MRNSWRSAEDKNIRKVIVKKSCYNLTTHMAAWVQVDSLLWIGDQTVYSQYPEQAVSFLDDMDF